MQAKWRVDRKRWRGGEVVGASIVAWFMDEQDAIQYVLEFATDHLNWSLDFDITEERVD